MRLGAVAMSLECLVNLPVRAVAADPLVPPIVKSWTVADFDPVISVGLEGYRDFENGRRQFRVASCAECHRFAGDGPERAFAPNLSDAVKIYSPPELLEAILSPDAEIAASDVVEIFELDDGIVIEGRVVGWSDVAYHVSPDPRKPDHTVSVTRSRITAQRRSRHSSMPSGLLDTLEEEDVLDLLAYLISEGNKKDPVFSR